MSDLEKLKKAIDEHFKREAEIAQMILEADLTPEEWVELRKFIESHEWVRQARNIFGVLRSKSEIKETLKREIERMFDDEGVEKYLMKMDDEKVTSIHTFKAHTPSNRPLSADFKAKARASNER